MKKRSTRPKTSRRAKNLRRAKGAARTTLKRLPFRTKKGGVVVKPGTFQRLALLSVGKFPKVQVDVVAGDRPTTFSVWLGKGRNLVETERYPVVSRGRDTRFFTVTGNTVAIEAMSLEEAPSNFVEVFIVGTFHEPAPMPVPTPTPA